jgi:uncharacterized glyoxalase superfamily metalloenzyme YdcJ
MAERFLHADEIRARFSRSMSAMYQNEVPAYGTLLSLVADVNKKVLDKNPDLKNRLSKTDNLLRINEERHGAIRIGTASELKVIARIFRVMGMYPVGYYDLTQANVPVHSTAFRPIEAKSLSHSPFRVFTSLLRTELIKDKALREKSTEILNAREIFTERLRVLLNRAEEDGGLTEQDATEFISEATFTFKWHHSAATSKAFYEDLKKEDPRAADIVCFKGPHINHLTPRTLDIDTIHKEMPRRGMQAKNVVEGPPPSCPVLLRQTSFKALTEDVYFEGVKGSHTARFGEIEQRSAALTRNGRALYDTLLNTVRASILPTPDGSNEAEYMKVLKEVFTAFPSSKEEMRSQRLAYFYYFKTDKGTSHHVTQDNLEDSIRQGLVDFSPVTYEDFLPVSAAGIFASNASEKKTEDEFSSSSKDAFEEALGESVLDEFGLYEEIERKSLLDLFNNG